MAVDPRLRVGDAILEPLAASGMLPARAAPSVGRCSASWAAARGARPTTCSSASRTRSPRAQLQRACLARALVVAPRYLICDELSSMLDVSTQAALLEVIAAVQVERELGVLLITHDRVLADAWCDEVVDIRELAARERAGRGRPSADDDRCGPRQRRVAPSANTDGTQTWLARPPDIAGVIASSARMALVAASGARRQPRWA